MEPEKPTTNNPFLSLISKFFPKPQNGEKQENNKAENGTSGETVKMVDGEEGSRSSRPDVVRFPVAQPEIPPLKLESEEVEKDTNPLVLWQIYALGGFIVLRWAWGKWQERKAKTKKDDSAEEHPPADDSAEDQLPTDE